MVNEGVGHVQAAVTAQAETESEVNVFVVAVVAFVKPTHVEEGGPQIHGRSTLRTKHFPRCGDREAGGVVVLAAPDRAADVVDIARAVNHVRAVGLQEAGGEEGVGRGLARGVARGGEKRFEPGGGGEGVVVEQDQPFPLRGAGSEVVCRGKPDIFRQAGRSSTEPSVEPLSTKMISKSWQVWAVRLSRQ